MINMAEEKSYQFNNDIWFIISNDVIMTLAIMEHLFANHKLKSTLCEYKEKAGMKCSSRPYVYGMKICALCRYEARKICAIYLDLPMECVEEIDREYLCTRKVELNMKMHFVVFEQATPTQKLMNFSSQSYSTYKIIFKKELPYLTPDIKQKEEDNNPKYKRFSGEDLQDQAKSLKYSQFSNFYNKHAAYSLDIERVHFIEDRRTESHSLVCMSNYIIKLWNYCALNGFKPSHTLKKYIFHGTFTFEPYEIREILKDQLNDHGLFEVGWKRFERIIPAPLNDDLFRQLILTCGEYKICLPFKTTHNSYELEQEAVPAFWDQVFSNTKEKDQNGKVSEGNFGALVLESQIIEILAVMEYLQLIKSNWSDADRRKTCAIYQQNSEVFVATLHSEFLIKKKIDLSFKPRKGEGSKLLCFSDKEYETVDNCSHTPSQEVSPEEMINVAGTLKWSSYTKFLSNYDTVRKSDRD